MVELVSTVRNNYPTGILATIERNPPPPFRVGVCDTTAISVSLGVGSNSNLHLIYADVRNSDMITSLTHRLAPRVLGGDRVPVTNSILRGFVLAGIPFYASFVKTGILSAWRKFRGQPSVPELVRCVVCCVPAYERIGMCVCAC